MATNPQDSVIVDDRHPSVPLGKMESDVGSVKASITEIRADLRATNTRLDLFVEKTDRVNVRSEIGDVRLDLRPLRSKVDSLLYWMIGSQAALLGVMAHGFKWV